MLLLIDLEILFILLITGGEVHDSKQAIPPLSGLNACNSNIAYRAYGTKDIRNGQDILIHLNKRKRTMGL